MLLFIIIRHQAVRGVARFLSRSHPQECQVLCNQRACQRESSSQADVALSSKLGKIMPLVLETVAANRSNPLDPRM